MGCGRFKDENKKEMKGQIRNELKLISLIGIPGGELVRGWEEKEDLKRQARPATNDHNTAP